MTEASEAGVEARDGPEESSMNVPADLSKFQLRILAVLSDADDAPKGVAVRRRLRGYYGSEVNHGRIYPNLDDLVDAGLVSKSRKDERTNAYGITDAGRDALAADVAWLVERTDGFEAGAGTVRTGPETRPDDARTDES